MGWMYRFKPSEWNSGLCHCEFLKPEICDTLQPKREGKVCLALTTEGWNLLKIFCTWQKLDFTISY